MSKFRLKQNKELENMYIPLESLNMFPPLTTKTLLPPNFILNKDLTHHKDLTHNKDLTHHKDLSHHKDLTPSVAKFFTEAIFFSKE